MALKKLLICIEWFAPGYKAGGPIQSCVNICLALNKYYDIYVLTLDTDHGEIIPYTDIICNKWHYQQALGVQVYYAQKKTISFREFGTIIKETKADYLYLNLLFSPKFVLYPLWLKCNTSIKSTVILNPRGSLYDSAISLKWWLKKPVLLGLKLMGIQQQLIFHATNLREEKAIQNYFPNSQIRIADNLPNCLQSPVASLEKIAGSLNCIFIARIVPIKNLLFLLELLATVSAQIKLSIVGPIEDDNYWIACKKQIALLPENITINIVGATPNAQLEKLLQQHHLFILPTTGENFGHSIFESLRAGRPVLISDQTPWLNLEEKHAGWHLPLQNKNAFVTIVEEAAAWDQQQFDAHATAAWQYAHNFMNNPTLTTPYQLLFS